MSVYIHIPYGVKAAYMYISSIFIISLNTNGTYTDAKLPVYTCNVNISTDGPGLHHKHVNLHMFTKNDGHDQLLCTLVKFEYFANLRAGGRVCVCVWLRVGKRLDSCYTYVVPERIYMQTDKIL